MAQLADIAAVAPPTMHRIIIALQKKKLLERTARRDNGKSWLITLTPAGKQLLERAQLELILVQDRAKHFLAADELDELHRLLRLYETAFSKGKVAKKKGTTNDTADAQ